MQDMDSLYQKYARIVYRYLLSLTRDGDLAEELTQETFYQAIRTSNRFDGSSRISTWLCGIGRNVYRTWRRKNPDTAELTDVAEETASTETDVLQSYERVELFRLLHLLEDPYREVLYLRVFGDLSFREIGEVLGQKENWARVTYFRGKEKLKRNVIENSRAEGRKNTNEKDTM